MPDEHWDTKHQLVLEREMLGLYVSGHPLRGVEHILARQADTPIALICDGAVAEGAQVIVGGILADADDLVVPELAHPGGLACESPADTCDSFTSKA